MTYRIVTISVSLDPPISGYGGWDEWTIDTMTNEQRDELLDGITELVKANAAKFKTEGGYTGQS